jgi:hypothetical protein
MRQHGEPTTPEPRKESTGIEAVRPGYHYDSFRGLRQGGRFDNPST